MKSYDEKMVEIESAIKRWESKLARAARAVAKLRAKQSRLTKLEGKRLSELAMKQSEQAGRAFTFTEQR